MGTLRNLIVLAAVSAAAGCNDSKLVAGPTCPASPSAASLGLASVHPPRPTSAPVFHPGESPRTSSPPDAVPATAQELITAMDVTGQVSNPTLTGAAQQAAAYAGLGTLQPSKGTTFAYLSTGVAGSTTTKTLSAIALSTQPGNSMGGSGCPDASNSNDCAALSFDVVVPAGMHAVAFDFNFLSTEFPEYVGTPYNDTFQVSMKSTSNTYPNIVKDNAGNAIDINSVLFTEPCTSLTGTGFDITDPTYGSTYPNDPSNCDAGATGMLTTQAPVTPGETVTFNFEIFDANDSIYDSAVMIDNFRFEQNTVTSPTTGTGTPTPTPAPSAAPTATPDPCGG